jgi:hypothetical protein
LEDRVKQVTSVDPLKYFATPCTLERWCKAYNQPKAASP